MPAIGAIVKAGAKSLAKEKAKSFITGKGKGKGGALQKTGEQKPTKVDPSSFMGRQVGGDKGGVDIPASQQTINVTPLGSDSPVGPSGGSGDVKIVQDISIAVSAIAESMKGGLVLKEKAAAKTRKAAERDKRAAQESDIEKPDEPKKSGGMPKIKVPGVGLLDGIFGFITKFIYGVVIMKLIEFAPQLKKVLGLFKLAQPLFNVVTGLVGGAFDLLTTFVDFGYKIADGAEKLVGKIFGEEGAEKFQTFMTNLKDLIQGFLIWKLIGEKIFKSVLKSVTRAFKIARGIIKNAVNLAKNIASKVGKNLMKIPGVKNVVGKVAQVGGNLLSKGSGLLSKGTGILSKGGGAVAGKVATKVGGFAAKIFGPAVKIIAPAMKAAAPAIKGFAGRIPILGPIVVALVSLISGEPIGQALFKGIGAAIGGGLGATLAAGITTATVGIGALLAPAMVMLGELLGAFVGDLPYE